MKQRLFTQIEADAKVGHRLWLLHALLDASQCGGLHLSAQERPASQKAQPSDALWSGTADTTAASARVRLVGLVCYPAPAFDHLLAACWSRCEMGGFQVVASKYAHVMQPASLAVLVPTCTSCICKPW